MQHNFHFFFGHVVRELEVVEHGVISRLQDPFLFLTCEQLNFLDVMQVIWLIHIVDKWVCRLNKANDCDVVVWL